MLVFVAALLAHRRACATPAAGKQKAAVCAACHGADGNSTNPLWPKLAGQTARYLYLQLRDFKEGRRKDPLMSPDGGQPVPRRHAGPGRLLLVAEARRRAPTKWTGAKVAEGKKIADNALCPMCHLGGFSGQNEIPWWRASTTSTSSSS